MIGLFLTTIGLSAVLTMCARRVGIRAGLLDQPDDDRKQHTVAVPAMGGIAVFAAFAIAFASRYVFNNEFASLLPDSIAALLGTASAIWVLGVVDDIWPVRAKAKLVVQLLAAIAYVVIVRPIDALHIADGFEISSVVLINAFCVFWLVACCNAVNLLDGMDGMASLQGMLGFTTLAVIASLHGDGATASVCLLLVASVFGFAIFNAPPASIFLGDAGSMTIGYLLGALTLSACHMADGRYGLAIPLAVMVIPAFDTTVAIVRRAQKGKGIMAPDREHFHHCLFDAGRSVWKVLGVFAVMYGLCAAAAIASVWTSSSLIASAACGIVLATCVATQTFGHKELKFLGERLVGRISSSVATVLSPGGVEEMGDSSPDVIPMTAMVEHSESQSVEPSPEDEDIRRAA